MNVQTIETDVLIIGSGIAGLMAALEASKLGRQVVLVSKSSVGKANNTVIAGGGFCFATDSFSVKEHIQKTLESGRLINDRILVECFVNQAPAKMKELINLGLDGNFHARGYNCRTTFLIGGPNITGVLVRACREANIRILENVMITDLIVAEDRCRGAVGFQKGTAEWSGICAKAVILATGGAGAIYAQHDNAPGITGDGYALAMKVGLELMDMEFVQFYPLLYAGSGRTRMVVPPNFADAGKIVNRHGEDIKEKYHLHQEPVALVSRDRLSQALFLEAAQGNGVDGTLLLDLRQMDATKLSYSSELIDRYRKKMSYDSHPVKIAPACHHTMGGIPIDVNGRTALNGLYAAGEVAGGFHGANRMGGNALSEGLVFGGLAGRSAADDIKPVKGLQNFGHLAEAHAQKWYQLVTSEAKPSMVPAVMGRLKQALWEKVGIVRDETSLKAGIEELEEIFHTLESQNVRTPQELWKLVECKNATLSGMAIAVSALERKESRGSHYREDFPDEDNGWLRHIHVRRVDEKPEVRRVIAIQ